MTLPIFLGITFAVIDYGLMMSNRSSAAGNISSLTRTIQDNPNISAAELNALVVNAGGGNVNFTSVGNCFCAQSFGDQASAQAFVNGAGCGEAACAVGGRDTGTANPRYIGVRGQVTYNFITPVNTIFTGTNTKVLKFGQVVPVGLNVCPAGEALTSAGGCTSSTVTCAAGEFLTSSGTCAASTITCPAGEFLSSSGVCAAPIGITCGSGQFLTSNNTCSAAVPNCTAPGQVLQFDNVNWQCVNAPPSGANASGNLGADQGFTVTGATFDLDDPSGTQEATCGTAVVRGRTVGLVVNGIVMRKTSANRISFDLKCAYIDNN